MNEVWEPGQQSLAEEIREKVLEFGADLVGFARVEDLKNGPSEQLFPVMKDHARDHFAEQITTGLPHGAVKWEEDAQTVIVFAVSHPEEKPEMDWWCGEINPPGNKLLAQISRKLMEYLREHHPGIAVYPKPYHVEKGGVYLKDAAVKAGLGCIGRSNLLVTPQYGPRVRLRAVAISEALPPTGPLAFDPCQGCDEPCRKACPQRAYEQVVYTPQETGQRLLPGRDGSYFRKNCAVEMEINENTAPLEVVEEYSQEPMPVIRYCRACEFACRAGKA